MNPIQKAIKGVVQKTDKATDLVPGPKNRALQTQKGLKSVGKTLINKNPKFLPQLD